MKGIMKRLLILSVILCLALTFAVSCDKITGSDDNNDDASDNTNDGNNNEVVVVYTLEISADKTDVKRGDKVTLSAILKAEGKDDTASDKAVYSITEGENIAVIDGNELSVLNSANDGDVIRVKAREGATQSNEIAIKVSVPVAGVSVSMADKVTNVEAGKGYALTKTCTPAGSKNNAEWVVTGPAAMVGDVLMVNSTAKTGDTITVTAEVKDGVKSETTLSFVVGYPLESFTAALEGSANVEAGTSVKVLVDLNPANATDGAYEVVLVNEEDDEYATIDGNYVKINNNVPAGTEIYVKVVFADANKESDPIKIVVGTPITEIKVSTEAPAVLSLGGTYKLNLAVNEGASIAGVEWVIEQDGEYATVNEDNYLVIAGNVPAGTKIKVYAKSGSISTADEALEFSIGVAVESVTVTVVGGVTEIVKGNNVGLKVDILPAEVAGSLVEWVFVSGNEDNIAEFVGNTLVISKDAKTGAEIVIKAVVAGVSSDEIAFTVLATQEEINAEKYYIELSADKIRFDKKGDTVPSLTAKIYNKNDKLITDMNVEFEVIEGAQYLGYNQISNGCTFTALGHGKATVAVKLVGTDIVETATVEVIVSPDSIELPEVFKQRLSINYAFSKVEALPFVPTLRGENNLFCTDVKYTFMHESGATGDEVAVYENGSITFKKTGKVTLTVSSASGSKVEAATSYSFDINEGYNVHNFVELYELLHDSSYNGQIINIVVLEKPVGNTGYEYGYDIVPPTALKAHSEQTIEDIKGEIMEDGYRLGNNRLQAVNKSLYLNGNHHKIDASQMRVFTMAEYEAYAEKYAVTEMMPNLSSLVSAEPWSRDGETDTTVTGKSYSVNIYNLEVVGNCPVDYEPQLNTDTGDITTVGVYTTGISIGHHGYSVNYYIDSNNLTASKFSTGVNFADIVGNGKVSNVHAYNCYSTGLMIKASIMTVENMKFGQCGATAIELVPSYSNEAGLKQNEAQTVTLAGTIDASSNLNDGNTNYFQNYTVQGATIPFVINTNMQMYSNSQVSHIRNANGEFVFVSLALKDFSTFGANNSVVSYPAYQAGGIINLNDIPDGTIDTTHEYIKVEIYVTLPSVGTVSAGYVYFYNHNYQGN